MNSVLSALACVPFAVAALAAFRYRRDARARRDRIGALRARETSVLQAVRSFVDASRVSSVCVIEALDEALRSCDPAIDVLLAFVPCGEELACIRASGDRAAHFSQLRLRRDSRLHLPARAAAAGHRVSGAAGVLIPTDRYALAVPMRDAQELRAVIYVASAKRSITAEEDIVRAVEHAASPYGLAIEREADRADATYDGLTGMLSPRAFRSRLAEEVDRARMHPQSVLTLWFIDTDRFKAVNDTHGHAAGDVVLQAMADLIRAHTVVDVDFIGRNGGDEFCALIFGTQKTIAIERAQRFCEAVRRHDFGIPAGLSASVGVATYPYDARTASELLEVADAAMYHSKRTGRDRVSFAVRGTAFSVHG
ncbi:MAG: GGDEF domain-containing protein [Candidatus Baltobacteraceae bacterium]